jgi:hypothetical protein
MCQSAGYIITKEAAARILSENKPIFIPADAWWYYKDRVDLRGIIPPLTLIRQDVSLDSTIQNFNRSEFTKGTFFSLLIYGFKTRSLLGRTLVKIAKKILRRV